MSYSAYGERFGIGRVFSLTFASIGRNIGPILLVAAACSLATYGLKMLLGLALASVQTGLPIYLVGLPAYFLNLIPASFQIGAITALVAGMLGGQRIGIGPALGIGVRCIFPLAAMNVLFLLGFVIGSVLLIVPGILLLLRWWVCAPVRVVEGGSVIGAFGRSAALTKGHRWKLFGLLLIIGIVALGIGGALVYSAGGLTAFALTVASDPAFAVVQAVINAVFAVFTIANTTAIYAELRRVKEGGMAGQLASVFE